MKIKVLGWLSLIVLPLGAAGANADVPINYLKPEGSIVYADSVPRGSTYYQGGKRIEKEAIDTKKLSCSLFLSQFGSRVMNVTAISGHWYREFGSHIHATDEVQGRIRASGNEVFCKQMNRTKGMITLSEIKEAVGEDVSFAIAAIPVEEGEFIRIPNRVISFRAPSVSVWLPAGFQPNCAFWSYGTYYRPDDCFYRSPKNYPVVEMNFSRNGLVHELKYDRVYESSSIFVSFEYVRKIYENRPPTRENIVSIYFRDKETGSSFDTFRVRMMLPAESNIAASLEDFHLHTDARFLVRAEE